MIRPGLDRATAGATGIPVLVHRYIRRSSMPYPTFVNVVVRHRTIAGPAVNHPGPAWRHDHEALAVRSAEGRAVLHPVREPHCPRGGGHDPRMKGACLAVVRPPVLSEAEQLPLVAVREDVVAMVALLWPSGIVTRPVVVVGTVEFCVLDPNQRVMACREITAMSLTPIIASEPLVANLCRLQHEAFYVRQPRISVPSRTY